MEAVTICISASDIITIVFIPIALFGIFYMIYDLLKSDPPNIQM